MADVRTEFVAALQEEATDDVATVLGESLAEWAGAVPQGAERTTIVGILLARAGDTPAE